MQLSNAHVLVTGATRGIGRAITEAMAARGARLSLVARNEVLLKEVAHDLGATPHVCDLADPDQVRGLIGRVEEAGGPLDVLVNNAGLDNIGPLEAISEEKLADLLHVNLLAPLELSRQALPAMIERRSGHIVNVSSYASATMFPGGVPYSASKAGLSHATEILRWELEGTGVDLTIVELGPIPTDMLDQVKMHRPTEAGFDRAYKLRLIHDVPASKVADHVVRAVEQRQRAVRLPIEARLFPLLRAAPQRLLRLLSTGIPNR
jgi:short-subunit dehydrogenase